MTRDCWSRKGITGTQSTTVQEPSWPWLLPAPQAIVVSPRELPDYALGLSGTVPLHTRSEMAILYGPNDPKPFSFARVDPHAALNRGISESSRQELDLSLPINTIKSDRGRKEDNREPIYFQPPKLLQKNILADGIEGHEEIKQSKDGSIIPSCSPQKCIQA